MSATQIHIERLAISLHGVSKLVAEAALEGLDAELARRLGRFHLRQLGVDAIGQLSLGPVTQLHRLDAAGLRGLIAERLVQALVGLDLGRTPEDEQEASR
jgi:hypothetical protein